MEHDLQVSARLTPESVSNLINSSKLQAAEAALSQLESTEGPSSDTELLRARICWQRREYTQAAAAARRAVTLSPASPGGYYWGALSALYAGDHQEVCYFGFGSMANCNPKNAAPADVMLALLESVVKLGLYDVGETVLNQIRARFPADLRILRHALLLAIKRKDTEALLRANVALLQPGRGAISTDFKLEQDDEEFLRSVVSVSPIAAYQLAVHSLKRRDYRSAKTLSLSAFVAYHLAGLKAAAEKSAELHFESLLAQGEDQDEQVVGSVLGGFVDLFGSDYAASHWVPLFRGASLVTRGAAREGVEELVKLAHREPASRPLINGCFSLASPEEVLDRAGQQGIIGPSMDLEVQEGPNGLGDRSGLGPVIFASCDRIYLKKFAELFVNAVSRTNKQAVCHLHITNADAESVSIIRHLRARYQNIQINVSHSIIADLDNQKARFACERFMRAEAILNYYRSDVLLTDIDLEVISTLQAISDRRPRADVCTLESSTPLPWLRYPAGLMYLTNSHGARNFLRLMCIYIRHVLDIRADKSLWFIDQNAIFAARMLSKTTPEPVTFGSLTGIVMFMCYTTETREAYTHRRMRELEIPPIPCEEAVATATTA